MARAPLPYFLGLLTRVVVDLFDQYMILIAYDVLHSAAVLCYLSEDRQDSLWFLYVLAVMQFNTFPLFAQADTALTPAETSTPRRARALMFYLTNRSMFPVLVDVVQGSTDR